MNALRLGDPLRREFLDELGRRAALVHPLAGEWALARADLTVALVDDPPTLVLAAGWLDGGPSGPMERGGSGRRWVLRLHLDDVEVEDLAEAVAGALDHVALLRPEQASVPRGLATAIREAVSGSWPLGRASLGQEAKNRWEDDGEPRPWAPPPPPLPPRPVHHHRRRRRGVARALAVLLVVAGAGVAGAATLLGGGTGRDGNEETAGPEPTAAAARAPAYTVQARNPDGSPVRFDPCRSYEYVVQPGTLAPEEAAAEAGAAFAALEEATGVAFRFGGFSEARFPHPIDAGHLPRLPILVSYEDAADSPALREGSHEHGGPGERETESRPLGGLAVGTPVQVRPGLTVVAGGAVVVDEGIAPDQRARVLLHELGHLAGLGHAGDPSQMMAASVPDDGDGAYRDGDRAGLAELGAAGGCALTDAERATVFP